ncbi:MAG: hypothetical protein LBS59_07685 [Puniceicoccales bacterium]|jgi:hypothetical protein|nr:hypothetical protein [Puniceicoccales bacterium]
MKKQKQTAPFRLIPLLAASSLFFGCLSHISATELGEKPTGEDIPHALISKIIAKNKMPDNFVVQFDYERLSDSEKWEVVYKEKLTWDFKNKRFFYTRLYPGKQRMGIGFGKFSQGEYVLMHASSKKNVVVSKVEDVPKIRKRENFSAVQAHVFAGKFEAKGDVFSSFLYSEETAVPLAYFLKEAINQDNFPVNRDGKIFFEKKTAGGDTSRYLFNQDGSVSRIEVFGDLPVKKGVVKKDELIWTWKVKKTGEFNGFSLPLQVDSEGALMSGVDSFFLKKIKERVVVDEKSVKVNQDLSESDFSLKFPGGAAVIDKIKGVIIDKIKGVRYVADGLEGENEESEGDSLEEFVKKAKEVK